MLVHNTERDGRPISITLEQEATELRPQWARAAATYIEAHYPELPLAKLLRCSISTAGSRAASLTIRFDILEESEEMELPAPLSSGPGGPERE